jgi:hypothetical protein
VLILTAISSATHIIIRAKIVEYFVTSRSITPMSKGCSEQPPLLCWQRRIGQSL